MSSTIAENSLPVEIDAGSDIRVVAFTANGEYLVSGHRTDKVRVWRVEDGKQVAAMKVGSVLSLAVSKDGKWIVAGTDWGHVFVWDAKTYEQVFTCNQDDFPIAGVDCSPDSTRLVVASKCGTPTVWDVPNRKQIQTLEPEPGLDTSKSWLVAAKYSPEGDRIATATFDRVRVWDSSDGHLLVDIPVKVTPWHNSGLLWSDNRLFVVSGNKVKQFEASTGLTVSEWPVPNGNSFSCISLLQNGEFFAYSTKRTIMFWDMAQVQLAFIQHPREMTSFALSPDHQFLAIGGGDRKITIQNLSCIADHGDVGVNAIQYSNFDATTTSSKLREWVKAKLVFSPWKDALVLATNHGLPRTTTYQSICERLEEINRIVDAVDCFRQMTRELEGETNLPGEYLNWALHFKQRCFEKLGDRATDAGRYDEAIYHYTSVLSLSPSLPQDVLVKRSEAYMATGSLKRALEDINRVMMLDPSSVSSPRSLDLRQRAFEKLGDAAMDANQYDEAISHYTTALSLNHPFLQSILSKRSEAFVAVGSWKEALEDANQVLALDPSSPWALDFRQRSFQTLRHLGDTAVDFRRYYEAISNYTTALSLDPPSPQFEVILVKRSEAFVAAGSWKEALDDANQVIALDPSSPVALDFRQHAFEKLGDTAVDAQRYDEAISNYTSALSPSCPSAHDILIKRGEAFATTGLWREALDDANRVITVDPSSPSALDLRQRALKKLGDTAVDVHQYDEAITHYTSALSLGPCSPQDKDILIKRCEAFVAAGLWKEALDDATQVIALDPSSPWALDFRQHSFEKLEHLGDTAVKFHRYYEAISNYTSALSLNPPILQLIDILTKRSEALAAAGSWKEALADANQVISLDPSSPWGYGMKHAALHRTGDYGNAVDALEVMLSRMIESPDSDVQQRHDQYIGPSNVRATIRKIVQKTIRHLPRVLIETTNGRLHNRAQLASAFESQPIFNELVSSMTMRIDYVWIKREVRKYFRYVMLSHKWEENEPLFQQVVHMAVYNLDKSPTHDKLQTFCKLVRDSGFHWAWSDTCCIDKSDHFVLQEALVAMFKWYQSSAMMIVFLRGVRSSSQCGALVTSIWNTRAWTLQEYFASKVIHFYTEDWTPYLGLELSNHKLSPEVVSEMKQATGMSAQRLMALRPGLSNIREKLRLASMRQTTLVEDAAYSLLGIFSVTGIPAIYGEGESSLGRLLAHVLTGSGDVSILAWTGESSSFNSCLPARITVFNALAISHIPQLNMDIETEPTITSSSSSFDLDIAMKLYDRLNELQPPWFAAIRMKLPCIAFQLPPLSHYRTRSGRIYRADTRPFGMVEIKTRHDLSRMNSLYLIHPWLDTLLEREDNGSAIVEEDIMPPSSPTTDDDEFSDERVDSTTSLSELVSSSQLALARPRKTTMDRETRARRLVARLRQPFGALLLTLLPARGRAMDYKRVSADSLITLRFQENYPLSDILDNVRTLDVL